MPLKHVKPALPHIRRAVWLALGFVALGLGILGVALPVLPTTPFVILAAFCFGKGSPRLRQWLVDHHIFGKLITDWEKYGAIAPRSKALACTMMGAVFLLSLVMGLKWWILLIQGICLGGAATFVLTRPNGPGDTA
ncbi:YbaN family protein [Chachezhania sediminis]|uniref:YbaN family protein n=1 Tax=Chachezhania sediminis TaxID=2599291 RepID=UPI001E506D0C|nr:YbaN family protein [Chachezhania sediminis]